jgi:hypothetical protein
MRPLFRVRCLVVAVACAAFLSLGCMQPTNSGGPATTPAATAPARPETAPSGVEVLLSDAKVIPGMMAFTCEVKYRVTKGQLDAAKWYVCRIDIKGSGSGILVQKQGKDLQPEGTLRSEIHTYKQAGKEYEIKLQESDNEEGPFRQVSNLLTGSAQ